MEHILYSKCSIERKDPYKIITSIIEVDGKKIVKKKAMTNEAKRHVRRMYENFRKKILNKNAMVKLAEIEIESDDTIICEFIEGKSYADIINEDIKNELWEKLFDDIRLLKEIILNISGIHEYENSSQFNEIFGEVELEGYDAANNVNIDMIPENIIIREGQIYLIDYEWTFDCLIPLKYILYRAIFFMGLINTLDKEKKQQIYDIIEVSADEEEKFFCMERAFQRYISGQTLQEIYGRMGEKNYVISEELLREQMNEIQVFNHKSEKIYSSLTQNNEIKVEIILKGQEEIRVRVCNEPCVIKVLEEEAEDRSDLMRKESNEIIRIIDDYYFGEYAEFIYDVTDVEQINLRYRILKKDDALIKQLAETYVEVQELRGRSAEAEKWNKAYQAKVNELEKELLHVGDQRNEVMLEVGRDKEKISILEKEIAQKEQHINELEEKRKDIDNICKNKYSIGKNKFANKVKKILFRR